MVPDTSYTYADYAALPEGAPYQLIGGQLVVSPSPTLQHQRVLGRIFRIVSGFVEENGLGEVLIAPIDLRLEDSDVYQPDLVFVAAADGDRLGERAIEGAPDLVVEVLSPSTAGYDLRQKRDAYERHGVKEYWIVDPAARRIEVYALEDGRFRKIDEAREGGGVRSRILTGMDIAWSTVFTR
jgi:Uma2 family endonuclease